MSILVLGPLERAVIRRAIKLARRNPMPMSVGVQIAQGDGPAIHLADRRGPVELARQEYPPQQIMLGTYRAAFSFERQPAGLFRHLSVSSAHKGKVPGPAVMRMTCEVFGFSKGLSYLVGLEEPPPDSDVVPFRVWVEEFEPGHYATNVVELEGA